MAENNHVDELDYEPDYDDTGAEYDDDYDYADGNEEKGLWARQTGLMKGLIIFIGVVIFLIIFVLLGGIGGGDSENGAGEIKEPERLSSDEIAGRATATPTNTEGQRLRLRTDEESTSSKTSTSRERNVNRNPGTYTRKEPTQRTIERGNVRDTRVQPRENPNTGQARPPQQTAKPEPAPVQEQTQAPQPQSPNEPESIPEEVQTVYQTPDRQPDDS